MAPTRRAVALVAVASFAALVVPAEVAGAAVALVLALVLADAAAVRHRPQLDRSLPADVVRGVPAPFSLTARAAGGSRLEVRQPQSEDLRFTPAEGRDEVVGEVVAGRRGHHDVPDAVTRRTGPLGLATWTHRHEGGEVVAAHVDLPGARRLALAVQQGHLGADGLRRGALGLGTDFESVREYAPDDDIRRVNWRATERTGTPMVNTYREDTERELWCLVDTGRLLASPVGDRTRLDVALDALAAVAAVADVVGDRVGAIAYDDTVHRVLRPQRANAAPLVRALEDLEPRVVDSDPDSAFARVGGAKRALVIVFTDLLDQAAARPLLDAVAVLIRRHAVVVASVTDPDLLAAVARPPERRRDPFVAAVASDLLEERRRVVQRLVAAGAVVAEASADELPTACVRAYLRLKAVARL